MSTLDELERSVERLNRAVERLSGGMGKYGFANVYNDDVQLLLSERAELLADVERMRAGLESIAAYYPPGHRIEELARAAVTTGEATIRLAASPQGEDAWITHDGGPSPVPGKMVDVRFRGSDVEDHTNCHSETWTWEHDGEDYDIIAYRVTEGVK